MTADVNLESRRVWASWRGFIALTTALFLIGACSSSSNKSATSSPPSAEILSPALRQVIESPEYRAGKWGLQVTDAKSGQTIYERSRQTQFEAASTTKIFSVATALEKLGSDHRFRTPVLRSGEVAASGELAGNLILVGQGDLTLGGRTKADGTVDVPIFDHYDANALPGFATITPEDPLAGLDQMAAQVANSGVKRVSGDVVVDDRLWDPVSIGQVPVTPIVVNDNLIDILITPGAPGAAATVTFRPETAAFRVDAQVTTTPAGTKPDITIDDPQPGVIKVTGTVNGDAQPPLVQVYQVPDPAAFARTLLIEALGRAGVTVDAQPVGANPTADLPPGADVARLPQVAEYESPPFSEYARLINKVSHNLGANLIPPLLAVKNGQRTYQAGMNVERAFVLAAGIDPSLFTLIDGQGLPGNRMAPEAQTKFLRYLMDRPYFMVFFDSTPVIGVDGSLATVIPPDDPARGHISAKTGTLVGQDPNGKPILRSKALAGYIDSKGGKSLVFAIYINDFPIKEIQDVVTLNNTLGGMASSIYSDQ